MRLNVVIRQPNLNFSQKYADEYDFGQESVDNQKYNWSVAHDLPKEIDEINFKENVAFNKTGPLENGQEVSVDFYNMTVLEAYRGGVMVCSWAISSDMIENVHKTKNGDRAKTYYYFYIKNNVNYEKLSDCLYVLREQIPDKLFS